MLQKRRFRSPQTAFFQAGFLLALNFGLSDKLFSIFVN